MQFNITFDSSVGSAPTSFVTAVNAVAQWFQTTFSDAVTVNITVGYGEVNGQNLSSGALGESLTYLNRYTYSQVRNALNVDAKSADDMNAIATLPATDPANANAYWVSTAEAKALGLAGASSSIDGSVGFSKTNPFDYDRSDGISPGQYDFYAVVAHEFSEVMGRTALLGGTIGGVSHSYEPMDLFRYASAGVRDFVASHSAYLSPDGGTTQLVYENTNPNGDFGDWAASAGNDAFLAFSNSGVLNQISNADLRIMDMIGWDLGANGSPQSTPIHTYDNTWTLSGIGDLNGDHHADLVWLQNSSGLLNIQLMNGTSQVGTADVTNNPFDTTWHIKGVADFNGDGRADLVWAHDGDGLVEIQLFNGTTPIGGGVIANNPFSSGWNVAGAADFNGDGNADLVWQRQSDGLVEIQFLNGNVAIGGGVIANNPFDSSWKMVGMGDFNGDHHADLVWQRSSDGLTEIQFLNGNAAVGGGIITNNPFASGWTVIGAADFNGDGKADLVWQRQSDHLIEIQLLYGNQAIGGGVISNSSFDSSWNVVGMGDFNADGFADLVYRRASDGVTEVQYLNGNNAIGGGITGSSSTASLAAPISTAMDHDIYMAGPAAQNGAENTLPVDLSSALQPQLQSPTFTIASATPAETSNVGGQATADAAHSTAGAFQAPLPIPTELESSPVIAGPFGVHQWDLIA